MPPSTPPPPPQANASTPGPNPSGSNGTSATAAPPLICHGPGQAWQPGLDFLSPGECHHVYRRHSRNQPNGSYQVTAITTWRVWWHINGQYDNELELQVGTTTDYEVHEIQVLTGRPRR